MGPKNKMYKREDKIKYFTQVIEHQLSLADAAMDNIYYAVKRLKYLTSDQYQDWSETVKTEIQNLKKKPRKTDIK